MLRPARPSHLADAAIILAALVSAKAAPVAAQPALAVAAPQHGHKVAAAAIAPRAEPAANQTDKSLATDFDDLEPGPARSAITFGRALDLQGLSLFHQTTSQLGTKGLFLSGRYLGPTVRPSGLPVRASAIASGYGTRWHPILGGYRFHAGIDLPAPQGAAVQATAPGSVVGAGWCGGYGWCVTLDHGGGVFTLYGHLSRIDVAAGQGVARGQEIGLVGSTGHSTGPHLHYEVRTNGRPIDPVPYLR